MSHIESDSGNITVVQRITPSLRVAASRGLLSTKRTILKFFLLIV
jgi:hypothetical protein